MKLKDLNNQRMAIICPTKEIYILVAEECKRQGIEYVLSQCEDEKIWSEYTLLTCICIERDSYVNRNIKCPYELGLKLIKYTELDEFRYDICNILGLDIGEVFKFRDCQYSLKMIEDRLTLMYFEKYIHRQWMEADVEVLVSIINNPSEIKRNLQRDGTSRIIPFTMDEIEVMKFYSKHGYDWVAIDKDNHIFFYNEKPKLWGKWWMGSASYYSYQCPCELPSLSFENSPVYAGDYIETKNT